MASLRVLPRDIQPGDVVTRDTVRGTRTSLRCTVTKVLKVRDHLGTRYVVYTDIPAGVSTHELSNRFTLYPKASVVVERDGA